MAKVFWGVLPSCPIFLRDCGEQSCWWLILQGPTAPQKRLQSFRLFMMVKLVETSNTNCMFLVLMVKVRCV